MVRSRATLPVGHGELVLRPEFDEWAALAEVNRAAARDWVFIVADRPAGEVRTLARNETLASAGLFSARLGTPVRAPGDPSGLIVMTGHQPELFHPGVWVKYFLMQRMARSTGATAVDIVVDSDGFDTVAATAPCMAPEVRRCRQYLAIGAPEGCYACTSVPSAGDIDLFCGSADQLLATLPAPSIRRHFDGFCEALRSAASDAANLAELLTFARRRYEAPAGTDYLELPVTHMVRSEAFATFVVDLALNASRFGHEYNAELAEYRTLTRTRSAAQPFPDLSVSESLVELPLWVLSDGHRDTLWAERTASGARLVAAGEVLCELPRDGAAAVDVLRACGLLIAPKAVALTLFARVFCCDLFIHGVGGARYDAVTDGLCRRYYAVEPPPFVMASLTMYLPLGAHVVSDEEVAAAKERLNRLDHNPNDLLGEVEFERTDEREQARSLAAEKEALVERIAQPGADKKALGARIREVNAQLAAILAPLRIEYEAELSRLEAQRRASEVFTDRGYPYCFWSPHEVADKVW